MTYLVSDAEMKRIAEELGLEIHFNVQDPGVHNLTTGETKDLFDYFDDFLEYEVSEETTVEELTDLYAQRVQPKKIKVSKDEFSYFTNENDGLAKIA